MSAVTAGASCLLQNFALQKKLGGQAVSLTFYINLSMQAYSKSYLNSINLYLLKGNSTCPYNLHKFSHDIVLCMDHY